MNVLLIEDDKRISDFAVKGLQEAGFNVQLADSGVKARELMFLEQWDIMLLDIMLPDIDGMELLKLLRYKKNNTPVLMLSALGTPEDRINALDCGADDFLVKPFHFKELISRINALIRRTKRNLDENQNIVTCASIQFNTDEHLVTVDNKVVEFSPKEYKLLLFLMENKNKVVSRTLILNNVWGINYDNNTNVVDVYISYLRNKLANSASLLQTIVGIGYMLKDS